MKLALLVRTSIPSQTRPPLLIILAAALAIVAGASGLVYPSIHSPLLVLGGLIAIATFIAWLVKPVWALYIALILVLLPTGLIPMNIHSMLNRYITVIAAGVWLVRFLVDRPKMVWTTSALFMLCFLVWSGVTLLWVEDMELGKTVLQQYSLRFVLFLFLIPNEILTKQDLEGLMKTLALSGWILMLSVVRTLLLNGYAPGSRLQIFSENENAVGILALVAMVGVVWQVSKPSERRGVWKALTTGTYILLTVGLVAMSGSRGSALSLGITLLSFYLWKSLHTWGKLALLFTIIAFIISPSIFTTLLERFAVAQNGTILGGREVMWVAGWRLISQHPFVGVGIGNSSIRLLPFLTSFATLSGDASVSIHNPILVVWSETGILGLILYLGILVGAVNSFVKQYFLNKRLDLNEKFTPYFALVASVFVGYLLSWIKGGGMQTDHTSFLLLALLLIPSGLNSTDLLADETSEAPRRVTQRSLNSSY